MSAQELTGASWAHGVQASIYEHVFSALQHEVGGFLLGAAGDSGRLEIEDAFPALRARGEATSVTITQDDWEAVHARLEAHPALGGIVGWYHSHPGFGIFLSELDLFIHRNFFVGPAQVAHVVDPHAGREGLFGWRDGGVVKLAERDTEWPAARPRRQPD
jgi:proteasome lid subunit RPN8/RPN11